MEKCSILIPHYGGINNLANCLFYLSNTIDLNYHQVIVGNDNQEQRSDIERLCKKYSASLIHNSRRLGYNKNITKLLKFSDEKYIVFLNNDVIPIKHWLDNLLEAYIKNEDIGLLSSKIISARDNTLDYCGLVFGNGICIPIWKNNYNHNFQSLSNKLSYFQAVPDCCSIVSKRRIGNLGERDRNYIHAWSDIELSLGLKDIGLKSASCNNSLVYHVRSGSRIRNHEDVNIGRTYLFYKRKDEIFLDLGNFVFEGLSSFLQEFKVCKSFILINAYNAFNYNIYSSAIKEHFNIVDEIETNFENVTTEGQLINTISIESQSSPYSLFIFCKSYTFIRENFAWMKSRFGKGDVILDTYCNIFLLDQLFTHFFNEY